MPELIITQEDVKLFSSLSHDVNPLHINADYARRTAFGTPVVFGILSALASLQYAPARPDYTLESVSLLFLNPLFVDVRYRLVVTEATVAAERAAPTSEEERQDNDCELQTATMEAYDGRRRVLQAKFYFRPKWVGEVTEMPTGDPIATRTAPAALQAAEVVAGTEVRGTYLPPHECIDRFIQRWSLVDKGIGAKEVAALAWTSYVVGMELPGEQAAYSRLKLQLRPLEENHRANNTGAYSYNAQVESFDTRFNLLQINTSLTSQNSVVAEARIWAFLRPDAYRVSVDTLRTLLASAPRLDGKVALVIGGSRGLGAALVQALALQGCTVYLNYARSIDEAEAVRDGVPQGAGAVHLLPGDASEASWNAAQSAMFTARYGGLDFLVCNASPAIRPLDFDPDTLERLQDFIQRSIELIAVPMAFCGEALRARQGHYVVISSIYAATAPAEFPHYVAAKCAIEGLLHSVVVPDKAPYGMLVRPPKLLTDQTNTPMGKRDAIIPEVVTAKVVALLGEPVPPEDVQIVNDFS